MEMKKDWQTKIFETFARKSLSVISLSKYFYFLIIIFLLAGVALTIARSPLQDEIYQIGRHLGQVAISLLGIVVLPGILGRFRIEIKITKIITLFRRQLGITTFLLGFSHYMLVRFSLYLAGLVEFKIPGALFETFGTFALFGLFLMFLTSNNFSVKKLGKWWKRLHRIVYVILWLLVLHTGLQRISIWSVGIFAVATLEVISFVYDFVKMQDLDKVKHSSTS